MTYNSTAFIKAKIKLENLIYSIEWHHSKRYPRCMYKYMESLTILNKIKDKVSYLNSLITFHEIDAREADFDCTREDD
jgi:hypothetical protein